MNCKQILFASGMSFLAIEAAQASPNLIYNPDFSRPSAYGTTIAVTATDATQLAGQAAAYRWSVWTGQLGGRVITSRTPTGDASGGYMLDVLVTSGGDGLVQAFLQPDQGPQRVYACVSVRLIRGSVGIGVGNGGNTGTTARLEQPGDWQLLGTQNGVWPANELTVYRVGDADAEFQVRSAYVGIDPVPCGHPNKFVRPQIYYKPETPPWQMHPAEREPGGDIQGASPSALGHFNNMSPAQRGTQSYNPNGADHEGHGGGKGDGKKQIAPLTQPPANQQTPAQ